MIRDKLFLISFERHWLIQHWRYCSNLCDLIFYRHYLLHLSKNIDARWLRDSFGCSAIPGQPMTIVHKHYTILYVPFFTLSFISNLTYALIVLPFWFGIAHQFAPTQWFYEILQVGSSYRNSVTNQRKIFTLVYIFVVQVRFLAKEIYQLALLKMFAVIW